MHELQLRSEPGGGSHVQGADVADHAISSEDAVVNAVAGDVPVDLRGLNLHGQQKVRETEQFGISSRQAVQISSVVRIRRLNDNNYSSIDFKNEKLFLKRIAKLI